MKVVIDPRGGCRQAPAIVARVIVLAGTSFASRGTPTWTSAARGMSGPSLNAAYATRDDDGSVHDDGALAGVRPLPDTQSTQRAVVAWTKTHIADCHAELLSDDGMEVGFVICKRATIVGRPNAGPVTFPTF